MTYHFEALGDERFQQLAQTLIALVFPLAQCLPVGQPDGGRDAFDLVDSREGKTGMIAFQVKFSRNPSTKDERVAIEETIKSEKPKVTQLIKQGATSYFLITNVSGTSHAHSGSIDKINDLLSSEFEIPSYCWWRDDLVARINAHSDVKWSFPEILKGTDLLQLLIEGAWRDHSQERNETLKSYIAAQCKDDEDVKFKQVGLQNKLIDLFVDIPVDRVHTVDKYSRLTYRNVVLHNTLEYFYIDDSLAEDDRSYVRGRRIQIDAAAMLLRGSRTSGPTRIVLEGAPGQGKSTITQYVCQVNRLKLLGSQELTKIPQKHREAPIRLPFRIDLRDFASWLSGRNPFVHEGQAGVVPSGGLESFIAAQVSHLSGGQEFTPSDLIAVAKSGHISVVLDGFDEVADVPTRRRVVDEITKAAARIQAHERTAQIIVTSRPAAFANSPGFPHEDWFHLEIQSMTAAQIDEYSRKWMGARHLPTRERSEFTALLKEKLEQPHMRDLARNPMQLTILLALIHTRGLSLPDKRTSLYDNYIELFFSRESEKSRVVREYRDLLVDIHRYLAWILHIAAEDGTSNGSISELELKSTLTKYLAREGHDPILVDELFTGIVERVVAIVSRVQGTFEFEVQPLREYFAARHLYETAPYSPPGSEKKGTKPERFDALARNFYWLNVLRFYCGCFSRGELSSLADGLGELGRAPMFRLLAHPRTLSTMLLADWVFSQQPLAVKRVVDDIFEQPGFKIFLANISTTSSSSSIPILPDRCGNGSRLDVFLNRTSSEIENLLAEFGEQMLVPLARTKTF